MMLCVTLRDAPHSVNNREVHFSAKGSHRKSERVRRFVVFALNEKGITSISIFCDRLFASHRRNSLFERNETNNRQVNRGGFADVRDFHQKAPLRSAIGTIHFAASRSDGSKSFSTLAEKYG
jgi:hypothetical protein